MGEGVVVAWGDTELYPVPNNAGASESDDIDRGVPASCFNDNRRAFAGRLKTTSVSTPHHLAPHVRGKGMQESPAFSLSD